MPGEPWSISRRQLLAGIGVSLGGVLAGCTGNDEDDVSEADLEAQIDELEATVAALEEENAVLKEQLESVNLWGFGRDTMTSLQSLADTWRDSVVVIDAITADGLWSVGTGWVFEDGVVATNAHVIEPRRLPDGHPITRYEVWDSEGQRVDGDLLGYTSGQDTIFEDREDIGFLSVPESMTRNRRIDRGRSGSLSEDDPLLQIGHPYSFSFWTPSVGPFVNHRDPFFASNIPGRPGVSGSPVLNLDGDLVGMTWGGQYKARPQRTPGDAPTPGDGTVLPAFERTIHGLHSYTHRIETAAEALL